MHIMSLPSEFIGKKFIEIFTQMKQERNSIVLAIVKNKGKEVISNPPGNCLLQENDDLIIISATNPEKADS